MNDLPTKPGPYYWREKDGDEWEIHTVFVDYELNNTLMAFCQMDETWYAVENWGGQWLPIPTAEELVELLRLVDEVVSWDDTIIDTYNFPEDGLAMAHDFRKLREYAENLRQEAGE